VHYIEEGIKPLKYYIKNISHNPELKICKLLVTYNSLPKETLTLINKQKHTHCNLVVTVTVHGCKLALPTLYFPGISTLAFSDRTEHALMEIAKGENGEKNGRCGCWLPAKNI